jgi:hypothetical protein
MDRRERLELLKEKFVATQKRQDELFEDLKSKSSRTVITKRPLYNVLPYENEITGYKLNGKVLKQVIQHKDCYIYYFDVNNNLVLIENMTDEFPKPYYFTMYFYCENMIETMYWQSDRLSNITHYVFQNGIVTDKVMWAERGSSFAHYEYQNDMLVKIATWAKEHKQEEWTKSDIVFHYDLNNIIKEIHQIYPDGYSRMKYS